MIVVVVETTFRLHVTVTALTTFVPCRRVWQTLLVNVPDELSESQAPLQPPNEEPDAGVAVTVKLPLFPTTIEQFAVQVFGAPELDAIVPPPVPANVTLSVPLSVKVV